jgi:hypothetical protein
MDEALEHILKISCVNICLHIYTLRYKYQEIQHIFSYMTGALCIDLTMELQLRPLQMDRGWCHFYYRLSRWSLWSECQHTTYSIFHYNFFYQKVNIHKLTLINKAYFTIYSAVVFKFIMHNKHRGEMTTKQKVEVHIILQDLSECILTFINKKVSNQTVIGWTK